MDEKFGKDQWLPMKSFSHVQASGKIRPIDNGRFSGHNALCHSAETIFTSSPDAVAAFAQALWAMLHFESSSFPDWAGIAFGLGRMIWPLPTDSFPTDHPSHKGW